MADKGPFTGVEIEKEAIERYNATLQRTIEREQMLKRFNLWRGNKLPPFSIEHMPYERQRLEAPGMTAEDRMLRKQWLNDQILAHDEPRVVPELRPKNPIRRMFAMPWNIFFGALKPLVGAKVADFGRLYIPRYALGISLAAWFVYHVKYNPNTWENFAGWHVITTKPEVYPGDEEIPEKQFDDFYDRGFKNRKALLNLETSTSR